MIVLNHFYDPLRNFLNLFKVSSLEIFKESLFKIREKLVNLKLLNEGKSRYSKSHVIGDEYVSESLHHLSCRFYGLGGQVMDK